MESGIRMRAGCDAISSLVARMRSVSGCGPTLGRVTPSPLGSRIAAASTRGNHRLMKAMHAVIAERSVRKKRAASVQQEMRRRTNDNKI
eukprot:5982334-Pyramimonas_sp.AAC.1